MFKGIINNDVWWGDLGIPLLSDKTDVKWIILVANVGTVMYSKYASTMEHLGQEHAAHMNRYMSTQLHDVCRVLSQESMLLTGAEPRWHLQIIKVQQFSCSTRWTGAIPCGDGISHVWIPTHTASPKWWQSSGFRNQYLWTMQYSAVRWGKVLHPGLCRRVSQRATAKWWPGCGLWTEGSRTMFYSSFLDLLKMSFDKIPGVNHG